MLEVEIGVLMVKSVHLQATLRDTIQAWAQQWRDSKVQNEQS